MFKYLLYALLIWFLYRFIVGFVIPVYRTTREVKKKFREMQDQMNDRAAGQQGYAQKPAAEPEPQKKKGDYIDFEEIK
jgi:hypothetical protein